MINRILNYSLDKAEVTYSFTDEQEKWCQALQADIPQEGNGKIFLLMVDGNILVIIAKCLNDEGISMPGVYKNQTRNYGYQMKNAKSNLWVSGKVRDILQNEAYIGTYICHKISTVRPREAYWNDEAEYLRFENAHEAIVSKNVFEIAQKSIQIRGKRGTYKRAGGKASGKDTEAG